MILSYIQSKLVKEKDKFIKPHCFKCFLIVAFLRSLRIVFFFSARLGQTCIKQKSNKLKDQAVWSKSITQCLKRLVPRLRLRLFSSLLCLMLGVLFSFPATEMVGKSQRANAGLIIEYFYTIGYMSMALIAWRLRDWHTIELAISIPPVIFLAYYL